MKGKIKLMNKLIKRDIITSGTDMKIRNIKPITNYYNRIYCYRPNVGLDELYHYDYTFRKIIEVWKLILGIKTVFEIYYI